MRKTTEELWKQAMAEQTVDADVPETFRRLCIENELECAEAVGLASPMPGTNSGFTMVTFEGKDVGAGTPIFTFPPAAIDRDSVIEECAKVCADIGQDWPAMSDTPHPEYIAKKLRALKSQRPATPDPRDEALRIAREALWEVVRWKSHSTEFAVDYGSNGVRDLYRRSAQEALAAIDKVMKG